MSNGDKGRNLTAAWARWELARSKRDARLVSGDHLNLALGLKNATLPAIIISLFPSYQI